VRHRHVSESVLESCISELHNALANDARTPRYLESVSRRGYRSRPGAPPVFPDRDRRAKLERCRCQLAQCMPVTDRAQVPPAALASVSNRGGIVRSPVRQGVQASSRGHSVRRGRAARQRGTVRRTIWSRIDTRQPEAWRRQTLIQAKIPGPGANTLSGS